VQRKDRKIDDAQVVRPEHLRKIVKSPQYAGGVRVDVNKQKAERCGQHFFNSALILFTDL